MDFESSDVSYMNSMLILILSNFLQVPIIISGLLAIKLPETYNENLPQTIKGAIDMEKRQQEARTNEGFEME